MRLLLPLAAVTLACAVFAPAPAATLNQPLGVAVDRAGNLYVANANAGVTVYDSKLNLKGSITSGVSLPQAVGVSVEGDRIYVGNAGTRTVTVYDQGFNQVGTISDSSLGSPRSLYIDGSDDCWVLDYAGVLHVYLADLTLAAATQTGGSAVGPLYANWSVWGVSAGNGYSVTFGNTGLVVHNGFSVANTLSGSPLAAGEAEDAAGNDYITDVQNSRVLIDNATHNFITPAFSTPSQPYGIAVDSQRGRIYVSFPQTYTVGVYGLKAPHKLLHTIN